MNVSGIRPGVGIYHYDFTQQVENQDSLEEPVKGMQEDSFKERERIEKKQSNNEFRQKLVSVDYAEKYQAGVEDSLEGMGSEFDCLDMEHAISLMQKDRVIEQYQFFVGEEKDSYGVDFSFRLAENFL